MLHILIEIVIETWVRVGISTGRILNKTRIECRVERLTQLGWGGQMFWSGRCGGWPQPLPGCLGPHWPRLGWFQLNKNGKYMYCFTRQRMNPELKGKTHFLSSPPHPSPGCFQGWGCLSHSGSCGGPPPTPGGAQGWSHGALSSNPCRPEKTFTEQFSTLVSYQEGKKVGMVREVEIGFEFDFFGDPTRCHVVPSGVGLEASMTGVPPGSHPTAVARAVVGANRYPAGSGWQRAGSDPGHPIYPVDHFAL